MPSPRPTVSSETPPEAASGRLRRFAARFGVAGFLFFLIKGLLWLAAPALLVTLGVGC